MSDNAVDNSPAKIVKANVLVEATFRLSLNEQRILLAVISQIDSRPGATLISSDTVFTIHAKDFAKTFAVDENNAYRFLQEGAESLFQRVVVIDQPYPQRPIVTRLRTRWVSNIEYHGQDGTLELMLAQKIIPCLTHLAREFTIYLLPSVAKMTSVHAVRLYELLVQWRGVATREIEIDWLRDRFGLAGKYAGMDDFKKRVLLPAVAQINEHSDLWLKWTQKKRGRRVVAFIFTFGVKEQEQQKQKKNKTSSPRNMRELIEKHARPGETWDQAQARLLRDNITS